MLEKAAEDGKGHIVGWFPCGKAFKIHKKKDFSELLLPQYFKQTKYRSFQRQLYIYGFEKIRDKTTEYDGAYFHALFVRGESRLCLKMSRQKIKGTGLSNAERKSQANAKSKSSSPTQKSYMGSEQPIDGEIMWSDRQRSHDSMITTDSIPGRAEQPFFGVGQQSSISPVAGLQICNTVPISPDPSGGHSKTTMILARPVHRDLQTIDRRYENYLVARRNSFLERRDSLFGTSRRGSMLYDGDEVSFGGKTFFFTSGH